MGNKAEIIKRYTTYGSIISMSDQIGSKKELIQNIYLVLTKYEQNEIGLIFHTCYFMVCFFLFVFES